MTSKRWTARFVSLLVVTGLGLLGCAPSRAVDAHPFGSSDAASVSPDAGDALATKLRGHISVLASDAFEGRHPTRPGGALTVEYLTEAFREIGLRPGNPNGSYVQAVPLIEYAANTVLIHEHAGRQVRLESPAELFAWSVDLSQIPPPDIHLEGKELVFAGYGISAPEYGWDDFGDIDLSGKVVLVLPGDPPTDHQSSFPTDAPSPHSTAAAKAAAAAERGAAAMIIIVDPLMNGSRYEVFAQSLARERLALKDDTSSPAPSSEAYATAPGRGMLMSPVAATSLISNAGGEYAEVFRAAASPEFTALELRGEANIHVQARADAAGSHNVAGLLEGGHPELRNQLVIYMAHWDHLGRDTMRTGDQIFNGAMDNAAGTAQLIEVARMFASRPVPPHRSVLFLGTTAEEANLLGSTFYATNPLYPLECTAAAVNLDGGFPYGRTHDVVSIGAGNTTLDEALADALHAQGRWATADFREIEYFWRSDHFAFARVGVPALFVLPGMEVVGRPDGWGEEMLHYFLDNHLHQPSDTLRADHDLRGLAEDARLLYDVGLRVASDPDLPEWKSDAPAPEFAEARAAAMTGFDLAQCAVVRVPPQ